MRRLLLVTAAASLAAIGVASSQDATMSFFVTSVGSGKGADLGGIAGADAHCASLAEAAGVTGKTWHAYLSTSDTDARDRIGTGPWFNAKGVKIADQTCGDWTLSGAEGAAMTGHHDRTGLDDSAAAKSWNSSHASRGGCSQEALRSTGGDGLFYCFAVN
ncbi:MAG: hypothetical protein E5Y58_20950 [Mesorhizobium sp.]|nr:MAG: hypothetical protein E5Y58_20950 [Mesorhizobium sp.]